MLTDWFAKRKTGAKRTLVGYQPRVEMLEKRFVPSTFAFACGPGGGDTSDWGDVRNWCQDDVPATRLPDSSDTVELVTEPARINIYSGETAGAADLYVAQTRLHIYGSLTATGSVLGGITVEAGGSFELDGLNNNVGLDVFGSLINNGAIQEGGGVTFERGFSYSGGGSISQSSGVFLDLDPSRPVTMRGNYNWNGGTIQGPGGITMAQGSEMDIASSNAKTLNNATLTVQGGANVSWMDGDISLTGAAPLIQNNQGAHFDILGDNDISGGGSFVNQGSLNKVATAGSSTVISVVLNNVGSGVVESDAGDITFDMGGLAVAGGTHSGTFRAMGSATITFFSGTYTCNSGTMFTGNGIIRVLTSAIISIPAGQTVANAGHFALDSGTIRGASSAVGGSLFWTYGLFDWKSGLLETVRFSNSTQMNLVTSNSKFMVDSLLFNYGTVNWTDGDIHMDNQSSPCTIDNFGTFNFQSDRAIVNDNIMMGAPNFINDVDVATGIQGVINKTGGNPAVGTTINVNFANNGIINLNRLTIVFTAFFVNNGTINP